MLYISRSKSSNSELVIVTLLKSFCLPALLYGIRFTDPSKYIVKNAIRKDPNLINRAVLVYTEFLMYQIKYSTILHGDLICTMYMYTARIYTVFRKNTHSFVSYLGE